MPKIYTLTLLWMALVTFPAGAQDFDADSVLYTPIQKRTARKHEPKKIFQDTTRDAAGVHYFFNVQVGPLVGCNDCGQGKDVTFTAATVHGVTIGKKLRTGIGTGVDSYFNWQTMPVFGSVSWDLLGTKNTQALFLEFNYGWAPFVSRKAEPWNGGFTDIEGRRMISPRIGYRIKYYDLRIGLSAGARMQRVYTHYEYPSYYYLGDGTRVEGSPNKTTVKQNMNRFVVTLTVGWK